MVAALPKDVDEIKETLDPAKPGIAQVLSTNVAAIQAQLDPQKQGIAQNLEAVAKQVKAVHSKVEAVEKQFDPKRVGTLAHAVHAISIDSEELILRHLVTRKLSNTLEEANFLSDVIKRKFDNNTDKIIQGAKGFPQVLRDEYAKPNVPHQIPSDAKIQDFLEIVTKVFRR